VGELRIGAATIPVPVSRPVGQSSGQHVVIKTSLLGLKSCCGW